MDKFETFCSISKIATISKLDAAINLIWFNQKILGNSETLVGDINNLFSKAHLPKYNITYLKKDLGKSSNTIKGNKKDSYRLSRKALEQLDQTFSQILETEPISVEELVDLASTPFLNADDIDNGKKMAELYLVIYCLENSVRKFIELTLNETIGPNWWDGVNNSDFERKIKERKEKEKKNKWLSPRGTISPLYYLDWSDLVKIIRKKENDFIKKVGDIKFVELRLEELERTRNIIAHNGSLPSEDAYAMLVLYFKNWVKQLV